jgi:hypothetical protein
MPRAPLQPLLRVQMTYKEQIAALVEEILEQGRLLDLINDISIKHLSDWEATFVKSIQKRFFIDHRALTEKQVASLVNILAWQQIDIS